jgi:hypothetical protein
VVAPNHLLDHRGKLEVGEDVARELWMPAHLPPFLIVERTCLEQDLVGHADLSDVVDDRPHVDGPHLRFVHTELPSEQ